MISIEEDNVQTSSESCMPDPSTNVLNPPSDVITHGLLNAPIAASINVLHGAATGNIHCEGHCYAFRVRVIDIDEKKVTKIPQYMKQTREMVGVLIGMVSEGGALNSLHNCNNKEVS